jgi:hypothetical protein
MNDNHFSPACCLIEQPPQSWARYLLRDDVHDERIEFRLGIRSQPLAAWRFLRCYRHNNQIKTSSASRQPATQASIFNCPT